MAATITLHRMHGGLQLEAYKAQSTRLPIMALPRPAELILPLRQHAGHASLPCVRVGDHVDRYQPLAHSAGVVSAPLHAPASGTVVAIENRAWPHPSGQPGPCIVLATDDSDLNHRTLLPHPDWKSLTQAVLLERIRSAGIVGLGGAGFPTDVKLTVSEGNTVHTLVLNGAECEPYISCDDMLMRERAERVITGGLIMMRALGAERCILALEEDKQEAHAAVARAAIGTGITIVQVPARYPQGGERQLIYALTGHEVPSGGLPLDIGIVCQNVGTAAAVADAIVDGRPLVSRIVTVAGPGVVQPRNFDVLFGTPVQHLIEACDGLRGQGLTLTMGGPMMGFQLSGAEVPVVKTMNCVLVREPEQMEDAQACIRCTECASVCPENLLPQQLHWYALARDEELLREHRLFDCIECGCCDVVCPSHIPLVSEFRWAKGEIRFRESEQRKATIARRRFEARQARLDAEKREREERLKRKQDPAAIDAALARIKSKAAGSDS